MRLTRDTIGGLFLIAIAVVFALSASQFNFGTPYRMGPGFYPILISALLGTIGLIIAISGLWGPPRASTDIESESDEGTVEFSLRSMAAVLGSLLAFGLVLERVGLVVAVFLLVAIASLAEKQQNIVRTLIIAVCLAGVAVVIFIMGLGLNIPLVRWPF